MIWETLSVPTRPAPVEVSSQVAAPEDSIMLALKQATASQHQNLEMQSGIWAALSSLPAYRALLSRMFGFYSTLEAHLATIPDLEFALPDVAARWKTPLLRRDLEVLGISETSCALCADLPALETVASAFGCLYVLEGSTLGGRMISQQVHTQLSLTPQHGAAFFSSYGPHLAAMWRAFGNAVEAFALQTASSRDEIVEGAVATFDSFSNWLSRTELEL